MPNKTKAEIRHAKLSAKAENAARKSLKNDKGINKNKRLVTKANKLNKRKNLGKDDIAYGMSPYRHSGTKKHNKKHSENPNWEHKDRSAGAIIGRVVNTVKDTGEKIGKGAEKIYKDAKETIKTGNKMSPYKLKPIPEGNKGKGLSKLPTAVRNKMGYQMAFSPENFDQMSSAAKMKPYKMDSSHSFKMKAAKNMKTLYKGSAYSLDPETDIVPEGTEKIVGNAVVSANAPDFKTVKIPDKTITKKETIYDTGKSLEGLTQEQLDWRTNKIKELGGLDEYHRVYGNKDTGTAREVETTETIPGSETTTGTQTNKDLAQRFDVFNNEESRQRSRRVIAQERKAKRAALKEARLSGLKGKEKRKRKREIKAESAKLRNRRLQEIARQGEMQDMQGLKPGSPRSIEDGITSDYTQVKRDRDNVSGKKIIDEALSMKLSPKAMNYFNRKRK